MCVGGSGRVRLDMVSNQRAVRVKISEWKARSFWDSVLNKAEKKGTQVKVWERQSHKQSSSRCLGGQSFPVEGLSLFFFNFGCTGSLFMVRSLSCSAHVVS